MINKLVFNTVSSLRQFASSISGTYDNADTLHNVYLDYGYPNELQFSNFWNMFRRLGVARRVVTLFPDQTWLDSPEIESTTRFETALEAIVEQFGLWNRMKGADTRQRVGRYGGIFMRVRDGKQPDQPIDGILSEGSLVDMIPLYESQLRVVSTDGDPQSDRFNQPTMYQFNSGATGNRNDKAATSFQIHPDRVVVFSEDSDNSNIYGVPALEAIYNSLMDYRKIIGGGAEGFYKNAAQNVVFEVKDSKMAVKGSPTELKEFNEQYDDFAMNRFRRGMWTPGMSPNVLNSNMVQSKEFYMGALEDIAAGSKIPVALLIGNQTGRLAGDQDTRGFLREVQSRRVNFGTSMVKDALDWFILYGILPSDPYTVLWPDALASSIAEKLENADKMAGTNQKSFLAGGQPVYSEEEIREEAGFDGSENGE